MADARRTPLRPDLQYVATRIGSHSGILLAQTCNFNFGKHMPSMHSRTRVRAAASGGKGNAKKHSGWHTVYCLKDSGATLVVINSRLVKEKQLPSTAAARPLKVN